MKWVLFILILSIAGNVVFGQEIDSSIINGISRDFKNSSSLFKRAVHFSWKVNTDSRSIPLLDTIEFFHYFNYKTKKDIIEFLGEPDTIIFYEYASKLNSKKIESYRYILGQYTFNCKEVKVYELPIPMKPSNSKFPKDQVKSVGFEFYHNCKDYSSEKNTEFTYLEFIFHP